jgi:hypothetical protein
MVSAIERRIARLEQRHAAVLPNVIETIGNEDDKGAVERFIAKHGRTPSAYIVVPARATEAELPTCEIAWAEMQRRLIADAKSERKEHDHDYARSYAGPDGRGNSVLPELGSSDAARAVAWKSRRLVR